MNIELPQPVQPPKAATVLFQPILTVEVDAAGKVTASFDWSESLLGELEPTLGEVVEGTPTGDRIAEILDEWLDGSNIANGEDFTVAEVTR